MGRTRARFSPVTVVLLAIVAGLLVNFALAFKPWTIWQEYEGHYAAISKDGAALAVASGADVRIFDLQARQLKCTVRAATPVRLLALSRRGARLATASGKAATVWSTDDARELCSFSEKEDEAGARTAFAAVEFTNDCQQILTVQTLAQPVPAGWTGVSPAIWSADDGRRLVSLSGQLAVQQCRAQFTPNDARILISANQQCRLWERSSGQLLKTQIPDGLDHYLLSDDTVRWCGNGQIGTVSLNDSRVIDTHQIEPPRAAQVRLLGEHKFVAHSFPGVLEICSVSDGAMLYSLEHAKPVDFFTATDDGNFVVCVAGNRVFLWRVRRAEGFIGLLKTPAAWLLIIALVALAASKGTRRA